MTTKTYIVQSKNDNLIKKSSSGGMFAELAKYILYQGGVVFGCTMERIEEGFDVKHIYIEDEKDLYKLQGSKYVQSNLGNTIKEAKEFLDKGRLVLFSGTPCQIAGLKTFLKQDYENLLTVDLSCTGTPTLKIFNDYIKFLENKFKQKIIKFEFRNKEKMGWSCGNAIVTFENKKQKILINSISSYLNLFINQKIQNKSCQNCKYKGMSRVSDITLADAWGVEKEYPELLKSIFDSKKGISLVLINSEKGEKVYENISKNLVINNVDIKRMRKYNHPLRHPSIKSKNWAKYMDIYNKDGYESLEKVFKKDLGWKYYYYIIKNHTPKWIKSIIKIFSSNRNSVDCLLMTLYNYGNYGSIITSYALNKTLNKLGFNCKFIHHSNIANFDKIFIKKHFSLTKRCVTPKDFYRLNKLTNTFILGSDNLINLDTNPINDVANKLLNFTQNNKKRLIISGSIGSWNGSTKTQENHDYLKYLLERFDYISTREEQGKNVFENVFNVEADWINDPVFYLEKQDFIDLTKEVKEDYSKNIMQYILYPTNKTQEIADFYKQKLGLETIKFDGNENVKHFFKHKNKTVESWLKAIIDSKLIITDSFHCTAFALMFNKPFVCIKNTHATVRFLSLFKRMGIDLPLIENLNDIETAKFDYDKFLVNKNLDNIRNFALEKIEKEMLAPKKEHVQNKAMEKYNSTFIDKTTIWYKKNRLLYMGFIVPVVIPVKRILQDLGILKRNF